MARMTVEKGSATDGGISWSGLLVGIGMVALAIYIFVSAPSDVAPAGIVVLLLGLVFLGAGIQNVIDYYKNK